MASALKYKRPTQADVDWVMWLFVIGCPLSLIVSRWERTDSDVRALIDRCLSGEQKMTDGDGYLLARWPWNARQDQILRTMRRLDRPVEAVARLLCRPPEAVKQRWKELNKGQR